MPINKLENQIKHRSKVAIVGFAPSWSEAPYDDEEFDIWGINELYLQAKNKRFTAWFEIHDPKSPSKNVEVHQKWLQGTKLPLYMQKHFNEYPTSIPYPRAEVKAMVNENFIIEGKGSPYTDFSNQITWMTLFAIYKGYKEIHIYGVDMAQQSEYCVSPDTKILMQDLTYKKAGELIKGDKIIAFEENFDEEYEGKRRYRRYKLAEIENNKIITRPSYKLVMSNGDELICSGEHQWLIKSSNCKSNKKQVWETTENIKIGTVIIKPLDYWETIKSYDAGYMSGALDGEGYLSVVKRNTGDYANVNLGFTQKYNEMLKTFKNLDCGINFYESLHSDGTCINLYVENGLPDILKCLGSIRPKRLLEGFREKIDLLEKCQFKDKDNVYVVKKEFLGDIEVVSTKTSTGTFIAEGYASHNSWQRSSCQFAIGFAAGRGIKILIPKTSELCKYPMDYGFETDNKNRHLSKIRVKTLKETLMGYNSQILDIEFQYHDRHKKFEQSKNNLTQSIQQIEDELVRLDIHIAKNNEVINFLKDMPMDPTILKTKKDEVSNNIQEQNKVMEDAKPNLEKQRKDLLIKLENETKLDFMNLRTLELTKEKLTSTINATNGAIGEVNYNLSNNRV